MGLIEHLPVLPHQGELLASMAPNKAMPGGYGSAKTMLLVLAALKLGQDNAPWPGMIIEPSFPMIRDVVVPQFEELAEEWGFSAIWRQERQRILIDLGDGVRFEVLLRSGDRPQSVVGVNAAYVLIDEAGHQKPALVEKATKRARHPKAPRKEVWLVGTPEKLSGPFYDVCEGKGLPGLHLVRARTLDNFFLQPSPEEYIRLNFSNLSDAEREAYENGRFVAKHGRIYTFYDEAKHEAACLDPLDGQLVLGADFGHNTMAWSFGRVLPDELGREHLHLWGEVVGRQTDTFKQLDRTKTYLTEFFYRQTGEDLPWEQIARRFIVYCDAAGAHSKSGHSATETDLELMRAFGFKTFRYPDKNPDVVDRIHTVQYRLREQLLKVDVREGAARYHGRCLRHHEYGPDGTPLKSKDDGTGEPGMDHGADDVGYICWERWQFRAPRPNVGYRRT